MSQRKRLKDSRHASLQILIRPLLLLFPITAAAMGASNPPSRTWSKTHSTISAGSLGYNYSVSPYLLFCSLFVSEVWVGRVAAAVPLCQPCRLLR